MWNPSERSYRLKIRQRYELRSHTRVPFGPRRGRCRNTNPPPLASTPPPAEPASSRCPRHEDHCAIAPDVLQRCGAARAGCPNDGVIAGRCRVHVCPGSIVRLPYTVARLGHSGATIHFSRTTATQYPGSCAIPRAISRPTRTTGSRCRNCLRGNADPCRRARRPSRCRTSCQACA